MLIVAHAAAAFTHNADTLVDALSTPHTGDSYSRLVHSGQRKARTGSTIGNLIQLRRHDDSCVVVVS